MRRWISISMAVTLLLSLVSPLLAGACMRSSGRASCHRVSHALPGHHCEGMAAGDEETTASASSDVSVSGIPAKCPMNCCIMADAGKQTAVGYLIIVAPEFAATGTLHSVAVLSTGTGHSSHANRGPPAA